MPELTDADLEAALSNAVRVVDPRKAVAFAHACRAADAVPALVRDLRAARARVDAVELLLVATQEQLWRVATEANAAEKERDRLRIQLDRAKANALTCVWCQHVFADVAALRQHTATCASHPVAAANAEIARLRAQRDRCIEALRLAAAYVGWVDSTFPGERLRLADTSLVGLHIGRRDEHYLPLGWFRQIAALLAELEGQR